MLKSLIAALDLAEVARRAVDELRERIEARLEEAAADRAFWLVGAGLQLPMNRVYAFGRALPDFRSAARRHPRMASALAEFDSPGGPARGSPKRRQLR